MVSLFDSLESQRRKEIKKMMIIKMKMVRAAIMMYIFLEDRA